MLEAARAADCREVGEASPACRAITSFRCIPPNVASANSVVRVNQPPVRRYVPPGKADAGRHHFVLPYNGEPIYHIWAPAPSANIRFARDSLAKVNPQAPLDKSVPAGWRNVTTGIGAVHNTAKVKAGDSVAVFGLRHGLAVIQARCRRRPGAFGG